MVPDTVPDQQKHWSLKQGKHALQRARTGGRADGHEVAVFLVAPEVAAVIPGCAELQPAFGQLCESQ